MKVFVVIALGLTAQTVTFAQNPSSSRVVAGTQIPKRGTAMTIVDFEYIPQTLKQLCDYSEVIVEGTVESHRFRSETTSVYARQESGNVFGRRNLCSHDQAVR